MVPVLPRKKWILVSGLVLAALIGISLFFRNSEPRYGGKTSSEWCSEYARASGDGDTTGVKSAEMAIRTIGSRGAPFVIENMSEELGAPPIPRRLRAVPILGRWLSENQKQRRDEAYAAEFFFYVLGPQCKSAIPALSNLVQNSSELAIRSVATFSLLSIGDDAVPTLCHFLQQPHHPACPVVTVQLGMRRYPERLTNRSLLVPDLITLATNSDLRITSRAIRTLGTLGVERDLVLPILTNALHGTNSRVRKSAVYALGRFGEQGYVESALSDLDEGVRAQATNALKGVEAGSAGSIDPEFQAHRGAKQWAPGVYFWDENRR